MSFVQSDVNPLEDASINEALASPKYANKEYSPFKTKEMNNYESIGNVQGHKNNQETSSVITEDVKTYDIEHQNSIQQLQKRQQQLDEKAKELNEREKTTHAKRKKRESVPNFPPMPSMCPCEACFYQNVEVEIPVQYQKLVNFLFYSWIAYVSLLLWNMFICLAYFVTTVECNLSNHSAVNFTLALFNIIVFTPASYAFWFRPIYKAFKYESSINFFIFFFVFSLQFVANIFQALAIDGWGFAGILNCLDMFTAGQSSASAVGVFMLLTGVAFGVLASLNLFLLIRVHQVYKSSGGSLEKAQEEFKAQDVESKNNESLAITKAPQ